MSRNLKLVIIGISFIAMIFVGLFPYYVVSQPPDTYWPNDTWEKTTPEAQNMSSSRLEEMYDYINSSQLKLNIHSLLIARNGYLIEDEYLNNSVRVPYDDYEGTSSDPLYNQILDNKTHHIWSATKSITSLLVGIALEEGFIDNISQTFFEIFPDKWDPEYANETKRDITIEHLLTMTHGLDWDELTDGFVIWPTVGYTISYVLNKTLVHEPGTYWEYSTGTTQLLSAIIQNKTGMKTSEFAKQYLFDPIGINDTDWVWGESLEDITFGGFGIYMTPRAMARIGLLCLNKGNWNGTQVVPEEWIDVSTSSQWSEGLFDPTKEYGYLWWLSSDWYSAAGFMGQRINVVPEYDIVVVFTCEIDYIGQGAWIPQLDFIMSYYIIGAVIPPEEEPEEEPSEEEIIPGYNLFLILGIISIGAILIAKRRVFHYNNK